MLWSIWALSVLMLSIFKEMLVEREDRKREGLKILLDGLQTIYGRTCARARHAHTVMDLCLCRVLVKPLTSHPLRLCLGPPGRLSCHLTGTWTYEGSRPCEKLWFLPSTMKVQPYQMRCTEAFWPQNSSQPVLLIMLQHYWNTHMLEWGGTNQFGPGVFAGWCEGKTWQTTWHFWGKLFRG